MYRIISEKDDELLIEALGETRYEAYRERLRNRHYAKRALIVSAYVSALSGAFLAGVMSKSKKK